MPSSEIIEMRAERERHALGALTMPATDLAERAAQLQALPEWIRWTISVAEVAKLATYVAGTDFVPEAMRDNPAAVTACILTGQEMHLGPMASLRHLHIVKGKVGQSAEIMRAKIDEAGHEYRFVDMSDTRCIIEGRRREWPPERPWTRITFTADQARRARIDLGGYPEDKLVARATTRLARRVFADVIAGLPTVDELEDGEVAAGVGTVSETPAQPPPVTEATAARRRRRAAPAPTQGTGETPPPVASPQPPLPGEPGYEDAGPHPGDAADTDVDTRPPTKTTQNKIFALMRDAGLAGDDNRDRRLRLCEILTGRTLTSSNDLTRTDASAIIDAMEAWAEASEDKGADRVAAMLEADERDRALDAAAGEDTADDTDDTTGQDQASEGEQT